jgi:hypothetical protein
MHSAAEMFFFDPNPTTAKMPGPLLLVYFMGPSLADVLLCTFESINAGFPSFPVMKLLS